MTFCSRTQFQHIPNFVSRYSPVKHHISLDKYHRPRLSPSASRPLIRPRGSIGALFAAAWRRFEEWPGGSSTLLLSRHGARGAAAAAAAGIIGREQPSVIGWWGRRAAAGGRVLATIARQQAPPLAPPRAQGGRMRLPSPCRRPDGGGGQRGERGYTGRERRSSPLW